MLHPLPPNSSQLEMLEVNTDVGESEITNLTLPGGKTTGQVAIIANCSFKMCEVYAAYRNSQNHIDHSIDVCIVVPKRVRTPLVHHGLLVLPHGHFFSTFRNLDCGHNAAQPALRAS